MIHEKWDHLHLPDDIRKLCLHIDGEGTFAQLQVLEPEFYQLNMELVNHPSGVYDIDITPVLTTFLFHKLFSSVEREGAGKTNENMRIYYVYEDALASILTLYSGKYLPLYLVNRVLDDGHVLSNLSDLGTFFAAIKSPQLDLLGKLVCLTVLWIYSGIWSDPSSASRDSAFEVGLASVMSSKQELSLRSRSNMDWTTDPLSICPIIDTLLNQEDKSFKKMTTSKLVDHLSNRAKQLLIRSWLVYSNQMQFIKPTH